MFATSCSQGACQAQAAWLCDTSAAAKHYLISCPKRSKGTPKKYLMSLLKPYSNWIKLKLFSFLRMFATSCSQRACQAQAAWLWDASATAKHHLISCSKRSNGNAKKSLTSLWNPTKTETFQLFQLLTHVCHILQPTSLPSTSCAWLCDASAAAKHYLISCPKRTKGTPKKYLMPLLKPY